MTEGLGFWDDRSTFVVELFGSSVGQLHCLLHVQVHEVVKQVKEYPTAAEEAVHNMKLADQRARLAEKAAARQPPQQNRSRAGLRFFLSCSPVEVSFTINTILGMQSGMHSKPCMPLQCNIESIVSSLHL